jgi:3-deoxy-manno-octulosonate cytidylyltransferase (CMP-KDO synthetase)
MTRTDHASGTDRLAEVAATRGWPGTAIVVNLQGDEPQAPASGIRTVAALLAQDPACEMATLAAPIDSAEQLFDPNCVKLVRDARGRALYFSRAPIPHARDAVARAPGVLAPGVGYLRHIGIYAYRAGFLRRFAALSRGVLESVEALEQLRALEHGHAIAVELAPDPFPAGVDTEQDLERVAAELASASAP